VLPTVGSDLFFLGMIPPFFVITCQDLSSSESTLKVEVYLFKM